LISGVVAGEAKEAIAAAPFLNFSLLKFFIFSENCLPQIQNLELEIPHFGQIFD